MELKIKQVMEQKHISIRQLSKRSGVARGYLSELINGKYNNPSSQVLCRIAKALGCGLDDIIDCEK